MKKKLINLAVLLTSLFGYLEWGTDQKMFLWEGEIDVLSKLITDPLSVLHPFTLLPMLGQILLLITLFQKQPSRWLTFAGIACLGLLLVMIFVVGLIGGNFKTVISTIPFLVTAVLAVVYNWKNRQVSN